MPRAPWADGTAAMAVLARLTLGRGYSFSRLLLLLFAVPSADSAFGRPARGQLGLCQPFKRAPGGILSGELLGAAHSARQRFARLAFSAFEANLNQKTLVVVRAALALYAVYRCSSFGRLQVFLQRRFVVAQRIAGVQFTGQLLFSFAHDPPAGKGPHRLYPAVKKQRGQNCLHGI